MIVKEEKQKQRLAIKLARSYEASKYLENLKIKDKILEIKMLLTDENLKGLKYLSDKEQRVLYDSLLDLFLPVIANLKFIRDREISRAKFFQNLWGVWRKSLNEEKQANEKIS